MPKGYKKNPKAGKQTSDDVASRASHIMKEGKELLELDVFSHRVRQFIVNSVKVAASALTQKEKL